MNYAANWLALLGCLLASAGALAQSPLEKRIILTAESPQAGNRLAALDRQAAPLSSASETAKFIAWSAPACSLRPFAALIMDNGAGEKWEQALEEYQKLLDEAGDALVPARLVGINDTQPRGQAGPLPSIQLRRLIQARIAVLPPSIVKRHRQSVDTRAQKLLDEGKQQRSAAPLHRLVDEYFVSSYTAEALEFLGDLAFEQGAFEDALAWWRQLAVLSTQYSVLGTSPAHERVRAKQVLAYAFLGQGDRAKNELTAYEKLYPRAVGTLAGADGAYASTLATWLKRAAAHAGEGNHDSWTTFAGNPARNRALNVCPSSRLWVDGPTWRVRLPSAAKVKGGNAADTAVLPGRTRPADRLCYHPLVVGSQVLIADAVSVTGYQLFTGQQLFRFVLKERAPDDAAGSGRYTLTAWNKRVFARLGGQKLGPKAPDDKAESPSVLVCLDLAGKQPGALLWRAVATAPDNASAFFEGAPLAADSRVFSAVSWVVGQRTHTALACYDAATGKRRWCQEVCATPEFEDQPEPRRRQHLLTLAGGRLYYCSHTGAVVALEPWSGQCLWGTRYSGRTVKADDDAPPLRAAVASPRDLAPCVYADDRLYLAPADADRLLCLDAANGRLLWERDAADIVHLLGVTRGRVYFATARGLQCLSADDGSARAAWVQPAEGRLPSLGRGLLAGSWLLWPTQDPKFPLRGVTLADGNQERFGIDEKAAAEPEYMEPTMLRAILPGNMAFGEDCLVVAGLEELAVYVPPKHFLKERQENLKDAKATPLALYQLAMSQADAGLTAAAALTLDRMKKSPSTAGSKTDWAGLSAARSAELTGVFRASPKRRIAKPKNLHAIIEAPAHQRGPLDLPLQKILETPARDVHSQWLGVFGDIAVSADSESVVGLDLNRSDGPSLWTNQVPLQPATRYCLQNNEPKLLSNPFPPAYFRCNSRLMFFMVDQRLLVALDPLNGQFAWYFWAPGGDIRPLEGGGRFYPHYHAGDRFILLQTTAGKRLTLDSQTGELLRADSAATPWTQAPLALDDNRLAVGDYAGQVLLLEAATGRVAWKYQPAGPTSLTGDPSQVFGDKDKLLALVPRNIGAELVRLDPNTGTPLWSVPFLPGVCDARNVTVNDDAVFRVCQDALQARSLRDGKLLWKKRLPDGCPAWQIVRAGGALLVYPREEIESSPLVMSPGPLVGPVMFRPVGRRQRERAILVLDPRDGQWLQRLPLADEAGPISVHVGNNRLVVSAGIQLRVYRSVTER